ncbi:radical SAM protein [bacterium]|nr:radical SAM protein [bacterium]
MIMNKYYDELAGKEYGDLYQVMKWVSNAEAVKAGRQRDELLGSIMDRIKWEYAGTKPYFLGLSPGCRLCGEGSWSCLFINSICNACCFYCPASQKTKGEPSTNTIVFTRPEDYIDYLGYFQFRGASISGGEPLMTLDRTMTFVSKIKRQLGNNIYLWLYTNGILLTESIVGRLKDAGLDEIRFDLSAVNYSLDKLKLASGKIPKVTVEVPAIPEDESILRDLVFKLEAAGVSYLNLHKLRCTVHNYPHLARRGYTLLHEEHATVLESELTALRILRFVTDNQLALPVNYCSFAYKHHFQSLAARRRTAKFMVKPYEDITPASFIRCVSIGVDRETACRISEFLKSQGMDEKGFWFDPSKGRLYFNEQIMNLLFTKGYESNLLCHSVESRNPGFSDETALSPLFADKGFSGQATLNLRFFLSYYKTAMLPKVSYHYPYKTVQLNPRKSIVIERRPVIEDKEIPPYSLPLFRKIMCDLDAEQCPMDVIPEIFHEDDPAKTEPISTVLCFEHIRKGLPDYF